MPARTITSTVTSLSWIPSEAVTGATRRAFEFVGHYDPPPPDTLGDLAALRDGDAFRFANRLSAYARLKDGKIVHADYSTDSEVLMGSTTLRVGPLGARFAAVALPVLRQEPEYVDDGSVRVVQTCGGRTAVPMPRPVPHPPYVKMQAPWVWTTLALTMHPDGSSEVELIGASAFPRHWVYDGRGALSLKSGLTDYEGWMAHSFGARTPWGEEDSPTLVTAAESATERLLSRILMGAAQPPRVVTLRPGQTLTRQGEQGTDLYVLLDGVLAVEVDGRVLAEMGPGAVLGERAGLEGGVRTSTLTAVTAARIAVAPGRSIDRDRLAELAVSHRREQSEPV